MHSTALTCEHGRPREVVVRWRRGWWDEAEDMLRVRLLEITGEVVCQTSGFIVVKPKRGSAVTINRSAIVDIKDA